MLGVREKWNVQIILLKYLASSFIFADALSNRGRSIIKNQYESIIFLTHPGQDHTFIVLAGKEKFYGVNGEVTELTKTQGILIPEGF